LLRARFEDRIYLLGHSWGTIIGLRAAQLRPDLFHAYIGTGQMVNVRESDQTIYRMLLENAEETGDRRFIEQMQAQGEPPYSGRNPVSRYARMFTREYQVFEMASIQSQEFRQDGDLLKLALRQPEYGWLDRVNYLRGLIDTFNAVYPQLQDLDFRQHAPSLDLPVYMVLGRHDVNANYWTAEEYFDVLRAPHKQLYIFEESGHGMIWQESDRFHNIMANTVLPETYH
jgi:pimeloyl-ACP methyl ester carboxylesterase